ncbi:DUF4329 domain-containing protein [Pseudomonas sp. P155]|uniref:DUF4329 domain-containing protein n=1 Tax=Pseudomonas neuropathica TaxID=2730425 RepID=A0ABS0BM35_9PSED|nr:DUF4329 domain-containing protein [Pseudomonas neuropathica]MBF6035516.1 DUF4329 domain-containing protein [Pseudomonas neuropathica]
MSDVSGRSGGAASSTATFKLPPVSPAFLSEEDAAYWVHTRIPLNPDKEYGSVILLRPDGKFLATSPIPGEATRFDFGTIVPTDARGDMLHPLGYRCIASVHSHPPIHDQFRNGNRRQDENLLRLFMSFYSGGDFIGDVSSRDFFRSAYLSGPDGSLLKYVSSGSPEERDYFLWHQSGAPSGDASGAYDVMALINKLATVGELNVIVSNADWGHSVGRVPADWTAGAAFSTGAVTEMPLMTRVCVNAERAVLAALKSRGAQTAGLILKKLTGEEYVATHARPSGLAAWDAGHLFPLDTQGDLQLPRGYRLEGFYFASRPDPKQFPPVQPWLYENFFSPHDMAVAIAAFGRNRHLAKVGRGLSLFMLAHDQAMLKYSFSGTPVEAALSVEYADGTISDNGLQARLSAGTLRPHAFVSMLVLAGKVEVLRGSALWANLGAVDLEWQPFSHFPWPALSREFLTADDAARHAHEKIGNRRDRQYVGYIFQRDNRFVVTEPLPGDIATLGQNRLYPQDNNGHAIFPDDHLLHARYVSHVALSKLDPADVDYPKWTFHEALLSLQMFSVDEIRQVLLDQVVLYASAVPDSLLRYESNGSSSAQSLSRRLGTRHNPGALATELAAGSKRPQDFIREQAASGRLTSLLDNQLWGYRGRIAPTWSVREAPPDPDAPVWQVIHEFPKHTAELAVSSLPGHIRPAKDLPALALPLPLPWRRPATVAYGAVFASADEVAQSQHAHDRHWQEERSACFGFILKHRERDEYIATERVPVSAAQRNLFELDSLFALQRTSPGYRFPDDFDLHASWYSHHHVEGAAKSPDDWLAHYFISPDNLTTAMSYGRRRPVIASDVPVALYIAARDGALLKYAGNKSSKLFHEATSQGALETIKNDLASGKWQPTDFVHEVANSGELAVMRAGICWDRTGPVKVPWQPYANLQRRWLGPVFQTADDAAIHARTLLPAVTDSVYGGLILETAEKRYVATAPIEVSHEDFEVTQVCPEESRTQGLFPADCHIVARYRSRITREASLVVSPVQKQIYLNMLSVDVLESAFNRRGVTDRYRVLADGSLVRYKPEPLYEYLFAPDGSVLSYQPQAELFSQLLGQGDRFAAVDAKAIMQGLRSRHLQPVEWINALAKGGRLQVIKGSDIWGLPRRVIVWAPYSTDLLPTRDYDKALSRPACSPQFVQADAAARYVHEASVSRETAAFGFILGNPEGIFLATLPVAVQRSALTLDRVFEQGELVSGFTLHGLYLRAALPPLGVRSDDVRQCFFMPSEIQSACVRADTPQGYLPIYFSCADGALLKLQLHAFEPGEFYDRFGQIEFRPNAFVSVQQAAADERDIAKGTFRISAYVHRMARAGKLEVIESSDHWSRHGEVGDSWQPRQVDVGREQRWQENPVPALGPVFHHPDDAARHTQKRATESVFDVGHESAILASATGSQFVPLEPMLWSAHDRNPLARIFLSANDASASWRHPAPHYPEGYTPVAAHQLHLSGNTTLGQDAEEVGVNFAAPELVYAHTHDLKSRGFDIQHYFYSTPHQVLLKYTPSYSDAERDLLLTRSVFFLDGRWTNRLSPGEFISRLMALGEFRVLVAGHYWRQTGLIRRGWNLLRQQPSPQGAVRVRDEL